MRAHALLAAIAATAPAAAEPVAATEPGRPRAGSAGEPPTAPTALHAPADDAAIASASPAPGAASGIAREDVTPRTDRLLWIPRALLFLPRVALWTAVQPLRGVAYAYERSGLAERGGGANGGFGVTPVALYETGFGFTFGARFGWDDLFGGGERLALHAVTGGRYRAAIGLRLHRRFGDRIDLGLAAGYDERPHEWFYGLGNGDELAAPPPLPLDPRARETALASRFHERLARGAITADVRLAGDLHARVDGALRRYELAGTGDDDSITMRYDTSRLAGFRDAVELVHLEPALVYDSRRHPPYQSRAFDATGWLARVYAGIATDLHDDGAELFTYGGELQRYLDLYDGSRVLALRAAVAAVGGADDQVPFVELPRLGGADDLRGYPDGRFRDRVAALVSAQYAWDLGNYLAAYAFVDAGRAFAGIDAIAPEELRLGFGGGVQLLTRDRFVARVQLAGSPDGDAFLVVALVPTTGRGDPGRP